jgi:hypothetical protein
MSSPSYARGSSTYGPADADAYAASSGYQGQRYDELPADTHPRASTYPGPADSTPSGYYSQSGSQDLDRPVASSPYPEPSGRDLTAYPDDRAGGDIRVAEHRADAGYDARPAVSPYDRQGAGPPQRSAEPWRPGSTGDYLDSNNSAAADGYQAARLDQDPAMSVDRSAGYGGYAR